MLAPVPPLAMSCLSEDVEHRGKASGRRVVTLPPAEGSGAASGHRK